MNDTYTIGKLAAASGFPVETIRYYQRRGLLAAPARPKGRFRAYDGDHLRQLWLIKTAKACGFTLSDIGNITQYMQKDDCSAIHALAGKRLALLEAELRELRRMQRALKRFIEACREDCRHACPLRTLSLPVGAPAAKGARR